MKTRILVLFLGLMPAAVGDDHLHCLSEDAREQQSYYAHLQRQAYAALDRRLATYETLDSPEVIRRYQQRGREFFVRRLGGFPEKTPLNAETVRTIEADSYRIENVIFESRPDHHVTANLYLPHGKGPFPGVVVSSGHSRTAKTADYNQRFGMMMARKGMAAICFDPIGQGERSQILGPDGKNRFPGTTTEHLLMGVGSTLVGRNTASYMTWDAMRTVDYLVSRPEIDPTRIGATGCSGGGTQTSYLMALDQRVACAAPSCYLTTFRRLIETIGPQDAEQNIYGQLAFGMDQPDYILFRAPQPTLISTTTQDFFDIAGSWDNFRQAKRIYGRMGFPERVDLVEVEGKHGVTPQNLATIAHWMQRWLLGRDLPIEAVELEPRSEQELLCTDDGQVLSLPGEKSVFELNAERETELAMNRQATWQTSSHEKLRGEIAEKIGMLAEGKSESPVAARVGQVKRDGYVIEKYLLTTDKGIMLPTLVFRPAGEAGNDVLVYLHEAGKAAEADAGGQAERWVLSGKVVVTVDLSGQGETDIRSAGNSQRDKLLGNWKTYYLAYLLEQPLLGRRVADTVAVASFANGLVDGSRVRSELIADGQVGSVALHAAALSPQLFRRVTLRDAPKTWVPFVRDQSPPGMLEHAVHGALALYDLPDLVTLAGPDKVQYQP